MKELFKKIITEVFYLPKAKQYKELASKYKIAGKYKRIYHYHIRKTGGTSLNYIFLGLASGNGSKNYGNICKNSPLHLLKEKDKIFLGWNKTLIEKGDYYYAHSHIPAHKLQLPKDTFTVTVLRDPIKRVVSLYKMIMEYKKNNFINRYTRPQIEWLGNSFQNFCSNISKKELLGQLYMFSANFDVNEAYQNITNCSHYFLTDNFNKGVDELGQKLDLKIKAIHSRKGKKEFKLSEQDFAILKQSLAPEIELYQSLKKK